RRLAAEFLRPDGQRLRDVAAGEHLDGPRPRHEPTLAHQVRRDLDAGVEALRQIVEVHDLEHLAKRVVESALRNTAMERHLPSLEPALVREPGAGFRPLVPASSGLSIARPLAAADALLRMLRPFWWAKVAQIHDPCP